MPGAFRSRFDLVAVKYRAGVGDYTERATAHYETARTMQAGATVATAEGVSTCWESPQAVRLWAHENELASACMQASFDCHRYWWNASNKAHQHACYCRARSQEIDTAPALTLAQVADLFAGKERERATHAPPRAPRLSALATCHASNAPGLPLHTHALMETGT